LENVCDELENHKTDVEKDVERGDEDQHPAEAVFDDVWLGDVEQVS
jgi:hypothetical protein